MALISSFELNSVVISIVIAFALTEILASWGRLVRLRDRVHGAGLYLALSAVVFLGLIFHWLGLTGYRDLEFERVGVSVLAFSPSICAALATFVLTPDVAERGPVDLRAHYFSVAPWVYPLLAAFGLLALISDMILLEDWAPVSMLTAAGGVPLLLWLAVTSRLLVHRAVLGFSLAASAVIILLA